MSETITKALGCTESKEDYSQKIGESNADYMERLAKNLSPAERRIAEELLERTLRFAGVYDPEDGAD